MESKKRLNEVLIVTFDKMHIKTSVDVQEIINMMDLDCTH